MTNRQDGEMAEWAKALAAKPDGPEFSSGTHVVGGEN